MDLEKFKKIPIIGILRGINQDRIEPLVESVISSGLYALEITMNTLEAPKLIRRAKEISHNKLAIGAGTVLNLDSLKEAIDSGASYIVLPALVEEVTAYCVKNNIPVFPGAFTPTEILKAWEAGAAMVKVFPAKFLPPAYFKEIKGPFEAIELLACGGVNKDNIVEFFKNGASAAAFGSSIFNPQLLKEKRFNEIGLAIKELIEALANRNVPR